VRRAIVAISALTFGLAGPRLTGDARKAHDAGEPFAYTPPEGFVADKARSKDGVSLYVHPESRDTNPTAVAVHHADKSITFADGELARLVDEMPKAFEDAKCTWVHRRHEVVTRPDGARVGLVEGDCDREIDLAELAGLEKKKIRTRKLQLLFPDDKGLSIATASFATEEAARWAPAIESTIHTAKGVAARYPPPSPVQYAMWAAAGAVLGWLAAGLLSRRAKKAET
jgi:hypothetical protein